jgi:mannose-6-phosphate isomerase-like protein (cupin superfamily)
MVDMPQLIKESTKIKAAGNKVKMIEEFFGQVNTKTTHVSIALMHSPQGWEEPGQKPEFEEYSIVLKGMLRVKSKTEIFEVHEGQAILVKKNEWVQYSTPLPEGAEYMAICLPAFSPKLVHREE